jgi:hypothetical protein
VTGAVVSVIRVMAASAWRRVWLDRFRAAVNRCAELSDRIGNLGWLWGIG